MALINKGVQVLTDRMPKVVSPRTHAILDYATAAGFFAGAALFWRNHKRAAIASLACGIAETAIAMTTDYPGGVTDLISFETHGRIDAGIAAGLQTLPSMMGFGKDAQAWFFRAQGMSIGAVTGLTDFGGGQSWRERERREGRDRRIA